MKLSEKRIVPRDHNNWLGGGANKNETNEKQTVTTDPNKLLGRVQIIMKLSEKRTVPRDINK